MNISNNVSLASYSTMHLGGVATHMAKIHSRDELVEALNWADERNLPVMMIGSGSNIVWRDEGFNGLILINEILGYEDSASGRDHYITIGCGENWDQIVARTVKAGLTGIECLSLVPGSAGGTPVQNVGAYGQEIADTLVDVEAYDKTTNSFVTIANRDCNFGYRMSRFKSKDHGRFFITNIKLHLTEGAMAPPFYAGLQKYLDENNSTDFSPAALRQAVIAIRRAKLPDPAVVNNCGSFFANPIIDENAFTQITANYPEVPHWPMPDRKIKLPAAWLIDQTGFKNIHDDATGMATWATQPLVLVNEHAKSTTDLLNFKQKIVDAVQQKFGITLVQEPELLP